MRDVRVAKVIGASRNAAWRAWTVTDRMVDFMAPAVSALEEVLEDVEIKKPRIPVISNVDAKPHSDPDTIKKRPSRSVGLSFSFDECSNKRDIT